MRYTFELWGKAREPEENPCMQKKNMEIPHRKVPAGSQTRAFRALTTLPPCSPVTKPVKCYLFITKSRALFLTLVEKSAHDLQNVCNAQASKQN